MKYTIELSEEQAVTIKIALEEYFRLRMNQTWDFADDICFEGFDYKNHSDEEFDKRIELRDSFGEELGALLNKAHPLCMTGSQYRKQTINMKRAQDIWKVIRHVLWKTNNKDNTYWTVASIPPHSTTGEDLPKMKAVDDKSMNGKEIR